MRFKMGEWKEYESILKMRWVGEPL